MEQIPSEREDTLNEVRVDVPSEHVEAVCDFIVEGICTGLVLEDEDNSPTTGIIFYSPPKDTDTQIAMLKGFLARLGIDTAASVHTHEIKNVVWEEEYRRSIKPIKIGSDVLVRPPWTDAIPGVTHDIVIEPKMAFGTGTHETTRSCLHVIRDRFRKDMRFLDLGCGSGILSILAAQLGASYLKAVDYDIIAVENSSENFTLNNVKTPHDILFGSIEKCDGDAAYDFVCANIIKQAILDMLGRLLELTARPGVLVLSGLLDQDVDDIYDVLSGRSVTPEETIEDNEWRTVVIIREAR